MSDASPSLRDKRFTVTSVTKTDPPAGLTEGNWFRYTIGEGNSMIVGTRSGNLQSVRKHAEEFAETLNQRAIHGFSTYSTRKIQTK